MEPEGIRARAEEISHGPEAGSALENWVRAEHEHFVAHYYDTVGHDLERLGMTIARLPLEAGVSWRLTLPRGEQVETWEPGTNGLAPPGEIMQLVGGILEGNPLVPQSAVLREPGGARLRAALKEQLEALLAHDPGVRLAEDPENLHQHRVAGRRVRALVRATRSYVDPAWARGLNDLLRGLAGVTGPARDLDVLLEHVRSECAAVDEPDRGGAEGLLAAFVSRTVRRSRPRSRRAGLAEYQLLLARLRLPPRFRPGVDELPLERLGRKEFDRLARAIRRLGSSPDSEAIHGLRIDAEARAVRRRARGAEGEGEAAVPRRREDAAGRARRTPGRGRRGRAPAGDDRP